MVKFFNNSIVLALLLVLPVMVAGLPVHGQLTKRWPRADGPPRRGPVPSYSRPSVPAGYTKGALPQPSGYKRPIQRIEAEQETSRAENGQRPQVSQRQIDKTHQADRDQNRPVDAGQQQASHRSHADPHLVKPSDETQSDRDRFRKPVVSSDTSAGRQNSRKTRDFARRIEFPQSTMQTRHETANGDRALDVSTGIRQVAASPRDFRHPIRNIEGSDAAQDDVIEIPLDNGSPQNSFQYNERNGKITLVARQAPIAGILGLIAQQHGLNIVTSDDVNCNVTVTLKDVSLDDALSAILNVNGYAWVQQKDILLISRIASESNLSPMVQGRQVAVFPLNFVSAVDVDLVVKGLLSPIGQSFISETKSTDKLRNREQVIVEDLPEYMSRIEQCIHQMDMPPRQVLVEAHVLQVNLKDDNRHGVNFDSILRIANATVSLKTRGFANPAASPAFFLGVDGTDLDVLIEALQTTTDAKTLASPRILAINGQEARIQIGAQLGYLVTTTTQTSTLQEVNFLDLGVVLKMTPQISADNRILLTVKPEVSSGRINPETGLPEEDTTEVQTTIMLNDGEGMIIGGLIKESDSDIQSKIPIVGDLWLVGKFFQRQTVTRERNEIIIALVPRIVPYDPEYYELEDQRVMQATSPLMDEKLRPIERPWEGKLPDAIKDPRRLKVNRLPDTVKNLTEEYPNPPKYYFPSVSEEHEEFERYETLAEEDEDLESESVDDDELDDQKYLRR